MRTVETSADKLAKQLKLGKLTAVRNEPGRLAAGSTVVYRTRISGSLKIDNQTVTFDSPSRTVDELLESYNVHARSATTTSSPPLDTVLLDGDERHGGPRRRRTSARDTRKIPFDTVEQADPDAPDRPDPRDRRTAWTAR